MILTLDSPGITLENSGGKGANLSRLVRAGYPVPAGFVVTTECYHQYVYDHQIASAISACLEKLDAQDPKALEAASTRIRAFFQPGVFQPGLAAAVAEAYAALGRPPIAVRSSATAEDLPEMSFAGQQDTYLNVIGDEALLAAVVRCWGSLWTARAIGYRARNRIDPSGLSLAVVIQEMIQSEASGVLFTANPLTGLRSESVIDATLGLGEALVSGQVDPDQYIVQAGGEPGSVSITSRSLGDKATVVRSLPGGGVRQDVTAPSEFQALPDHAILALAELGRRVADSFGSPQDIEWAWAGEKLYLLQARPVTSLYPLPEGLLADPLQVLASFGAVQGMLDPMTPLGRSGIAALGAASGRFLGYPVTLDNQPVLQTAGERLYINITALVRNRIGRRGLQKALLVIEPGIRAALEPLWTDIRLDPGHMPAGRGTVRLLHRAILPVLLRVLPTLCSPDRSRAAAMGAVAQAIQHIDQVSQSAVTLRQRLDLLYFALETAPPLLIRKVVPCFAPGVFLMIALDRISASLGAAVDLDLEVTRGLPHNVTTQMDLDLWATASAIQADPTSARVFFEQAAPTLADDYLSQKLPPVAQGAITRFLERYGLRAIAEIDLGRKRWREDPTPVMQTLQSYLQITDPYQAPDAVFSRGAERAEAAIQQLVQLARAGRHGWLRAHLVAWVARRVRALAGLRELPKFFIVSLMGIARSLLLRSGEDLVQDGLLDQAGDISFLTLQELEGLAARQDPAGAWLTGKGPQSDSAFPHLRARITERRSQYEREKLRRRIPRLLLSDGRAFYDSAISTGENEGLLLGSPVSPGMAEGRVRVVFDPYVTRLEPGEILVCPGTDPAWTPLFLSASGLIMEVGGLMTHGSVVAREYGLPAVAGVRQATTRLVTGQWVRVDGSTGRIELIPPPKQA